MSLPKPESAWRAAGPARPPPPHVRPPRTAKSFACGDPLQLGDAALPDLSPGDVDDRRRPPGRGGWRQAEVGEDVLHLLALVEAEAAHQAVGDAAARSTSSKARDWAFGPVENGEIGERIRLVADQPLDLAADRERLLLLVVDGDEPDRLATAALGPEAAWRHDLMTLITAWACRGWAGWSGSSAQGHHVRVGKSFWNSRMLRMSAPRKR